MELDRYEKAARSQCEKLHSELIQYDLQQLYARCSTMRRDGVLAFLCENETRVSDYIHSTVAQRTKSLAHIKPEDQSLFLMCALYHARIGWAMLHSICHRGVTAGPDERMITLQASAAARDLRDSWPTLWPFEDIDDPFA